MRLIKSGGVPACLFALLFLLSAGVWSDEGEHFVEDSDSRKFALILVGAAVDDERATRFGGWAISLRDSLQQDYGYAADNMRLLMGSAGSDDFNVDGPCRADAIGNTIDELAETIRAGDQLNIFFFGHGTGGGENAKFNIVGPDLTGGDFAALLDKIATQNIVVVNTTGASHDFGKALSGNGRVVVSATRSAAQKYDTVFPAYFVEALKDHRADRDKNRRVSVLEAFDYARARVENYFQEENILASEHASLDDNGDGVFSTKPHADGDGRLAEIAYFDVTTAAATNLSPAAAQLRNRMSNLERDIFLLRAKKSALGESEYWTQLEPLLIQLAKVTSEFNEMSKP